MSWRGRTIIDNIIQIPAEITEQLSCAQKVIERHLADKVMAIHLFGSAVDGGLKPQSDIDLLVTVSIQLDDAIRQALLQDLLTVSVPPDGGGRGGDGFWLKRNWRSLEVTVLVYQDVLPWRYPPRRELQFGEWLRREIEAGRHLPPVADPDLTILIAKARQHSIALVGPPAETFFAPIPRKDFLHALADCLALWEKPEDWQGDERNIMLTLARIWYSAATGQIAPKDMAASWVEERLPAEHRLLLAEARAAYLGELQDDFAAKATATAEFIRFAKAEIRKILAASGT
ncbi:MAG TPA: DUF4111 domain-containing protein [Firmicutes bacterium]|nr:DUF4111 domain-containing protein [Bacillota bacterium]